MEIRLKKSKYSNESIEVQVTKHQKINIEPKLIFPDTHSVLAKCMKRKEVKFEGYKP